MKRDDAIAVRIVREAMETGGRIGLATLVERAFPVTELRAMAQRHGIAPKGFRVERAPPTKLATMLVDAKRPDVLEETCRALLDHLDSAGSPAAETDEESLRIRREGEALVALRTKELTEARAELGRMRAHATAWRTRETELHRAAEDAELRAAKVRAELDKATRSAQRRPPQPRAPRVDDDRRVRDLEREREDLLKTESEQRRLIALRQARIRELDDRVQELLALVPKHKRDRKAAPAAPTLADDFRVPYFLPSFYKSLEDKERRSIEKAIQAALLFCTEGHSYPGLEVKQIEGQDLWSLRASLRLRVYFRFRHDGDVDFIALADREDQHTTLRRLKER